MGFKLSIVLAFALVMVSGAFKLYYDKSEAEKMAIALQLQTAMDNQLRLENAIETQNAQIEKQISDKRASDTRIELLTVTSNQASEKIDELREKFARHDLNMLSLRKPGLIEKVVNRGTARVFKELEDLTNAEQTASVKPDEETEG
jgi:accessory colonization factor AcfC